MGKKAASSSARLMGGAPPKQMSRNCTQPQAVVEDTVKMCQGWGLHTEVSLWLRQMLRTL